MTSPEIDMLFAEGGELVWLGWCAQPGVYKERTAYLTRIGVRLDMCQIRYAKSEGRDPETDSIWYLLGDRKILEHQWRCLLVL